MAGGALRAVIPAFEYQPRTRIIFGPGTIERLGEVARELPATRVLLVTDKGVEAAGHLERAQSSLAAAGVAVTLFDDVIQNPATRCVEKCRNVAQDSQVDAIVGLGGGSSLDTAKGCNFLLTNGGRMQDYWGTGKAAKPMLPLIAVPTTAGTGSECQSYALITDEQTHRKMACGDPKAAARVAILDPLLTLSQPPRVAARTGIDTLAHAVETAVTRKRSALSFLYSREAFQLAVRALPKVTQQPQDLEGRGAMLLAAAWAGTAIENSMLGAAHAAANPLTARFGIVHGEAVGIMLPWVVRFNAQDPASASVYQELERLAQLAASGSAPRPAGHALAAKIEELLQVAGLPSRLRECGVDPAAVDALARDAMSEWTGSFNPRPVTEADFQQLYRQALDLTG
jgi:alcohol dehydrogenase